MRKWTDDEAEDFRSLISSLLCTTQMVGVYITSQDPGRASESLEKAHELVHIMERLGYVRKVV